MKILDTGQEWNGIDSELEPLKEMGPRTFTLALGVLLQF